MKSTPDNTRGGSEFSRKGCEWLGCSQSTLQRWSIVGMRADELTHSVGKLPNSEPAIARIASLGDEQWVPHGGLLGMATTTTAERLASSGYKP